MEFDDKNNAEKYVTCKNVYEGWIIYKAIEVHHCRNRPVR